MLFILARCLKRVKPEGVCILFVDNSAKLCISLLGVDNGKAAAGMDFAFYANLK